MKPSKTIENVPDEFQVTQEHIDSGKAKNSQNCALALAIQEAFDYRFITVRYPCKVGIYAPYKVYGDAADEIETLRPQPSSAWRVFKSDSALENWVCMFDKAESVKPITVLVNKDKMTLAIKGVLDE